LLGKWADSRGGMLGEDDAKRFLSWIMNGACDDKAFAAKFKELFEKVFTWRKGFLQSIVIARAAADLNPKLSPADLKAIAQQVVNGKPTTPLSRAAATAVKKIAAGGSQLLKVAAKKILPGLVFLNTAMAVERGWAGRGHTGDGAWGALNEAAREAMIADVVEPILFPAVLDTVDGATNLLAPGINASGRNRYIRRGRRVIDLDTGRIVD
jgi:hypothetical protein